MNYFSPAPPPPQEPQSLDHSLFIAFPYPTPAPPSFYLVTRRHFGPRLIDNADTWWGHQFTGHTVVFGLLASHFPLPGGSCQRSSFSSFTAKENSKEKANKKTLALLLDIESQQLMLLVPPAPPPAILCPSVQEKRSVLLQPEDGHPQGMPMKESTWEVHGLAACVGLLWNGSLSLALVC